MTTSKALTELLKGKTLSVYEEGELSGYIRYSYRNGRIQYKGSGLGADWILSGIHWLDPEVITWEVYSE